MSELSLDQLVELERRAAERDGAGDGHDDGDHLDVRQGSDDGIVLPWWQRPFNIVVLIVTGALLAGMVGWMVGDSNDVPDHNEVDVGFLQDMRVHHEQAVLMSFIYRSRPDIDPGLNTIARSIIMGQNIEVGRMIQMLRTHDEPEANESGTAMLWMSMVAEDDQMPGMASDAELEALAVAEGRGRPHVRRPHDRPPLRRHRDGRVRGRERRVRRGRHDGRIDGARAAGRDPRDARRGGCLRSRAALEPPESDTLTRRALAPIIDRVTRPTRTVASIVTLSILAAACANDAGVRVQSAVPILPETTAPAVPTPTDAPDETTAPTDTALTTQAAPPTTVEDVTEPLIIEPELAVSIPFTDVVDADAAKPARDHDGFVAVAFTDIERWWNETFPAVYGDAFEPLDGGLYAGYPERSTPIPGCGEPETNYDDLQLFVAFYCNVGDFMAYDDGDDPDFSLLTPLADAFGPAVMGVVLAHEYGHAIQERIGALDRPIATIITEQQADCFAGAWTGQAYRGESPLLRLGDTDVRAGLSPCSRSATRSARTSSRLAATAPPSTGSAFQVGFLEGPARCAELLDDPLPPMPNQFQPFSADAILEGNAPYDCDALSPDAVAAVPERLHFRFEFLADDLLNFWEVTFADEFGSAYGGFTVQRVDSSPPSRAPTPAV
ncbi:MAG: DUF305 domain-containing protein [Ilumatobacteraceae bacterium]